MDSEFTLPLSMAFLLDHLPGIATVARAKDPDQPLYVSREVETLFQVKRERWLEDPNFRLRLVHPEDVGRILHEEIEAREQQGVCRSEYRVLRPDGSVVWVRQETRPIVEPATGEVFLLGWISNHTSRKQTEETLQQLAFVDELTGLYNRRGFNHLANRHIQLSYRTRRSAIVMLIDVDQMKAVNDTWGHAEGDRALLAVTRVLRDSFRTTDILGRIGGDEFAVLAVETDQDRRPELLARLRRNAEIASRDPSVQYPLRFSVGTAYHVPDNPKPLKDLLEEADRQLYEDKGAARRYAPREPPPELLEMAGPHC